MIIVVNFSWKGMKGRAITHKIAREISKASSSIPSDEVPADYVRDAQTKNFAKLKIDVKLKMNKLHVRAQKRRDKLAGK